MPKIKRNRQKGSKKILDHIKAQRGLDRVAHFATGGTLTDWMGGPRLIEEDKKKKNNKNWCRRRVVSYE